MPGATKKAIFAEKGMRLVRSWEIMMLLAESSKPLSSAEINEMVHRHYPFSVNRCSVQTTNEDLKTLQKCGFPVCRIDQFGKEIPSHDEHGRGRYKNTKWCLRDTTKLETDKITCLRQPTAADIISLSLCRALLHDEVPSQYPLRRTMARVLEELQIRLHRKLRQGDLTGSDLYERIRHIGREYVGKSVSLETWNRIVTAIAKRQILTGEYRNREGVEKAVAIAPCAVWFTEGRAYLLTSEIENGDFRVWRLDRFSQLVVSPGKKAAAIAEEDIEQALRRSFKGYVAEPEQIVLQVSPRIAYLFREFRYHESQQITEHDDGSLTVNMQCSTGWGFEEWLLGFGEFVTVQQPDELRHRLNVRIKNMASLYEQ